MASRFWVGGTGTWDSSTTTHWAASSGGAGGQSVPGSADDVTFDGASGGGTVTLNFGGPIAILSLACGAFTGTIDNSVNNNNITVSASGTCFNFSGTGTRTLKLGTATYTASSSSSPTITFSNTTGLTYTGNTGATFSFTGTGNRTFTGGGLSHGTLSIGAQSGSGRFSIAGANTFANLSITAPNLIIFPNGSTNTVSSAFTISGSSSNQIGLISDSTGATATIAAAASSTAAWVAFRDLTFTGSPTATNSFNLGNNSGISISSPGGGGSAGTVIGS